MLINHYNLLAKYGNFKRKKTINLPKSSQNLSNFTTFLLKMWQLFGNFQKNPLTMLFGIIFLAKWQIVATTKKPLL
jgi:hypothetical protein